MKRRRELVFGRFYRLIHQHASFQRLRAFNRREQAQELRVVATARVQTTRFRFTEVVAQDQVEKVVIIGVGGNGKLTCVGGQLRIIRAKAGQHVEYVVGRQMRSPACQPDGNSQFIET